MEQLGEINSIMSLKHKRLEVNQVSELQLIRRSFQKKIDTSPESYWHMLQASEIFSTYFMDALEKCIGISPKAHWREALRVSLTSTIPRAIAKYFDQNEWRSLDDRLCGEALANEDIEFAAWLILFDVWIWSLSGYEDFAKSPVYNLVEISRKITNPILQLSLAIRDASVNAEGAASLLIDLISDRDSEAFKVMEIAGWSEKEFFLPTTSEKIRKISPKFKK